MFLQLQKFGWLIVIALSLTVLFWWPLYFGAGFIGGDLYPYFFPQKAFYADCLTKGQIPLWNDLVGFGYPVVGESQTGVAYPFHFLLYQACDLNTAYNIEHLLHYVICFCATFLFAKRLGQGESASCLAAIVFTYGWFPARSCLEWAILTGAWMPVALYCAESFIQTRLWRYAIGLSMALGLQLLAGHFNLTFITLIVIAPYSAWRLWSDARQRPQAPGLPERTSSPKAAIIGLSLSLIAGVGLAAVQVLPTWELKQRSSRVATSTDYDPAYGHMPPAYASQLVAPWLWFSLLDVDEDNLVRDLAEFAAPWHWFGPRHDSQKVSEAYSLENSIQRCRAATASTGTNKVEAHCYCGLVPIGMALGWIVWQFRSAVYRRKIGSAETIFDQTALFWLIMGLFGLIYATGVFMPVARHIPGFGFFRGPGRYGIITTFAVALFAGSFLDRIERQIRSQFGRYLLVFLIMFSTCGDLWLVSRIVKYTVMVSPPRISFRDESPIRKLLLAEPVPPRLLAPGPNVCTMLGVSSVPWYLGIAPSEYVDPTLEMPAVPKPSGSKMPIPANPDLLKWLSKSGVTHVLSHDPLDLVSWQIEPVWDGFDPFLNRVWGRSEPIFLYRFRLQSTKDPRTSFPGRAYAIQGDVHPNWTNWNSQPSNLRRLEMESETSSPATVLLTELAFPGWKVKLDGVTIEPQKQGMFRTVDLPNGNGTVLWSYEPDSVYFGAVVSLLTALLLATIGHIRFWHPAFTDRIVRPLGRWIQ